MSGSMTASYVRTGYHHHDEEDEYRLSHPGSTMSLTPRHGTAKYTTSLYPFIAASETVSCLCTINSDDEDKRRSLHVMLSPIPHLRNLRLPAHSELHLS